MAVVAQLVAIAEAKQPWFWASASVIALVLLLGNILLLVAVHARRIREGVRGRRAKQARAHVEELLAELGPGSGTRDPHWLGDQVARFDELERPIAARMLIERLMPASEEERRHALQVLREAGVVDVLLRRGARSFMPWRRALAIRTLGWIGATEAVPLLIERAGDRNRWIAQAAVRALGRIGDADALGRLAALFRNPGPVGTGVVYDALIGIGRDAQPVFAHGLESPVEAVRVASCFGVSALSEPDEGRRLLDPVLADPAAAVRAAAAEAVADVSGDVVPETLARATRDDVPAVRRVAVVALGFFADPRAVDLAAAALVDPDREVVIRAGESLVRLTRLVAAAPAAVQALTRHDADWPIERARTLASLEAV